MKEGCVAGDHAWCCYRRVRCVVVDRLLTRMKLVDRTELLNFILLRNFVAGYEGSRAIACTINGTRSPQAPSFSDVVAEKLSTDASRARGKLACHVATHR